MPIVKRKHGTRALFGGEYYAKTLGERHISWESIAAHRLWCYQTRPNPTHTICVLMFNPGSLSGDGKNLSKDTTLRYIREAMPDTAASLILNLFTRATPDPDELLEYWDERDCDAFTWTPIISSKIDALVYAYGDIGQRGPKRSRRWAHAIRQRIDEVKELLSGFPELTLPEILLTKSLGNPKHPRQWSFQKQIPVLKESLTILLESKA